MKKLLLTGFEPFLNFAFNPTESIVEYLDGRTIGNYTIHGVVLPVDFNRSAEELITHYHHINPDAVITLGMAAHRKTITPERVAINIKDGAPDNDGYVPEDEPIQEDGADAYFSELPIKNMVACLREKGIPAEISNTAGTYLCNNVMYSLLHELHQTEKKIPAGFVHIPASFEIAMVDSEMPAWPLSTLQEGIETIIQTLD
ncbi:pyroglutamyl-peptidase I [Halobacillus sp. K22]|uniref:pyroglutamyl-peptidase I n=1 Tax=Halobacillus sp. K22 TaxID=3457431 RepID=UPI003FCD5123